MPEQRNAQAPVEVRERRLSRTFVALADTLVDDFDLTEFLKMLTERCVELLECSAVGVLLLEPRGGLRVAATSSERAELLELFAVQTDAGPCVDCARSGKPVGSADLAAEAGRWPRFAMAADACGFRAMQALPMRLRDEIVGVLSLFSTRPGELAEDLQELGQALADVATIAILQQRHIARGEQLAGQLQAALTSRIVIEQAKGVLAERGSVSPDEAFDRLRRHARSQSRRLTELATEVVSGSADLAAILAHTAPNRRRGAAGGVGRE
jgi:GAF domain-containing protein